MENFQKLQQEELNQGLDTFKKLDISINKTRGLESQTLS